MLTPLFIPMGSEWIILIVLVVVLLFGARKIPELARSIGKAKGEYAKGQREAESEAREKSGEREQLETAAKALGINVEGKSDVELREELRKALGTSTQPT